MPGVCVCVVVHPARASVELEESAAPYCCRPPVQMPPTLADDMERVAQAARDFDRADIRRLERIGFGSSNTMGRFPAGTYLVRVVEL